MFSTKSTDYFIHLNPIKSDKISTTTQNTIETNFDLPDNIIYFEDSTCNINDDKTRWSCYCCMAGDGNCGAEEEKKQVTTTARKYSIIVFVISACLSAYNHGTL
jgi:hypothetical protein